MPLTLHILATRDAICMADDISPDDKMLISKFEAEEPYFEKREINISKLIRQILVAPNFLAFASDTGYQVFSGKHLIAKVEKQSVILPDPPVFFDQFASNGHILLLHFAHYTGVR